MALSMSRLQLATRIHRLLLREIGHDIEVQRLLADARYARDVLLVCDAVPGGELVALASLFRMATSSAAGQRGAPGHVELANDWGRDTSGFGLSQPPPMTPTPATQPRRAARAELAPPDAAKEPRRSWLSRLTGGK